MGCVEISTETRGEYQIIKMKNLILSFSFELVGGQNCLLKNGNEMAASYACPDGDDDDSCPEKPECLARDYSISFFSK